MKRKITLLLIAGLVSVFSMAGADVKEDEIQAYIARQTEISYKDYVSSRGVVSSPEWEAVITTAFTKLTSNSGERVFKVSISIVRDTSFNAMCFGGGQFVINSGALDFYDAMINKRSDRSKLDLQLERELLVAPLIGHELGHYYNRHFYKMLLKYMEQVKTADKNFILSDLQFSVANEYEADYTGWLLLKKAKYNPELMASLLEMLSEMEQSIRKESGSISFNQYFLTHPSPHKRLARIQNDRQEYHKMAAELERVFDDVQVGINLERSIDFLDRALKKNPGNIFLKKERAVALHKLWLTTVPVADQKVRGILDAPSFRDEMLSKTERERSRGAGVPGNEEYYKKALAAYKGIVDDAADNGFISNYALLLVYSGNADDRTKAQQLALKAAENGKTIYLYSNYAVVLYLAGEKDKALNLISQVAQSIDSQYKAIFNKARTDSDYLAFVQQMQRNLAVVGELNKNYVLDDFTPYLNYALMVCYSGDKTVAKTVATKYINEYENKSQWAEYVSKLTGISIPKPPARKFIAFQGIKIADNIKDVLGKWGKADRIDSVEANEENWYYGTKGVSLLIIDGVVNQIDLQSKSGIKIDNGIGVGSTRIEIEKAAGRHKYIRSGFYVYEGDQNMAVVYVRDVAIRIILFP